MAESTFTLRVDDELKIAFAEAARQQDRTGAQLVREFMKSVVQQSREKTEYEAWFAARVQEGLDAIQKGEVVVDAVVKADSAAQRAALLARVRGVVQ